MTVKINGKPFDFDGKDLYEGERTFDKQPLGVSILWMLALSLLSYASYPWVVKAITLFFKPLLLYFGIPF
jgi:hypothetical protein